MGQSLPAPRAPRECAVTYTTTKHGITGLTKTLALDGGAFNIAASQINIGNPQSRPAERHYPRCCRDRPNCTTIHGSQSRFACGLEHVEPAPAREYVIPNHYGDENAVCCTRLNNFSLGI